MIKRKIFAVGKAVLKKTGLYEKLRLHFFIQFSNNENFVNLDLPYVKTDYRIEREATTAFVGLMLKPGNGIAEFNLKTMLTYPQPIHIFTPNYSEYIGWYKDRQNNIEKNPEVEVFPIEDFSAFYQQCQYQKIIFCLGNHPSHISVLELYKFFQFNSSTQCYVYLHDPLMLYLSIIFYGEKGWRSLLLEKYRYLPNITEFHQLKLAERNIVGARLILRQDINNTIIVNSEYAKKILSTDLGINNSQSSALNNFSNNCQIKIASLFHPVFVSHSQRIQPKVNDGIIKIGVFGWVNPLKGMNQTIKGIQRFACSFPCKIVFAGPNVDCLTDLLNKTELNYTLMTSLDTQELLNCMNSVDVAVQLRPHNYGEASGIVNQLIALRKKVVVSGHGSFEEFGQAVIYVPRFPSPDEVSIAVSQALQTDLSSAQRQFQQLHTLQIFYQQFTQILSLSQNSMSCSQFGKKEDVTKENINT